MKRTEETLHPTGRRFSRNNQKVDRQREREKKKGEREGGGWVVGAGGARHLTRGHLPPFEIIKVPLMLTLTLPHHPQQK